MQLPPNAFFNREVNLESLYGIYCYFLLRVAYYRILITFLSTNKDLLIYIDYLLNFPKWSNSLYDPAKSTKVSCLILKFPYSSLSLIVTINNAWDREEKSWILFEATTLFFVPFFHVFYISFDDFAVCELRSSTMKSL